MRRVKKKTSFAKWSDEDVCVYPFAGGTPSGDATGTTWMNTDFSVSYECLYFA